jgi:hypothetical protein
MKYTIKKIPNYNPRGYWILDESGEVVKEFDAYNHQRPFQRAKEWIREQEDKK